MNNNDTKWLRISATVVLMLTAAPLTAVIALHVLRPDRWGETINPLVILAMWLFGLFTTPLWPTYIPAIILTPWLMGRVAGHPAYGRIPVALLCGLAVVVGALAGVCVMFPLMFIDRQEADVALMWAGAGAVSGAITLTLVALLHRFTSRSAQPDRYRQQPPALGS